jgi:hypothetical protein
MRPVFAQGRVGFSASSAIRHHNFKRLLAGLYYQYRPVSVELAMIRPIDLHPAGPQAMPAIKTKLATCILTSAAKGTAIQT